MSASIIKQLSCLGSNIVSKLDELLVAIQGNSPIDYTALFNQIISELQDIDANTDNIEATLTAINTDTTAITTNTANTVTELQNVISELQDIDANTDNVEQLLTDILNALLAPDAEPTQAIQLPDTCVTVDGADPQFATPVVLFNQITGVFTGKVWLDKVGNEITGTIAETDPCDCDCVDCDNTPVPVQQGFDVSAFVGSANTKYNLDDPTASNAYGDVGLDNWTAADLAASLNANAASAVPPIVPSGIDYSTTVFAVSTINPNVLIVTSGPVPTSISLVSIPADIPLTTI